jgi:hypothetical protein
MLVNETRASSPRALNLQLASVNDTPPRLPLMPEPVAVYSCRAWPAGGAASWRSKPAASPARGAWREGRIRRGEVVHSI